MKTKNEMSEEEQIAMEKLADEIAKRLKRVLTSLIKQFMVRMELEWLF